MQQILPFRLYGTAERLAFKAKTRLQNALVGSFLALPMLFGVLAAPVAAQSQDTPVVVELFTSQGCSSCPPADALIAQLAERTDVLALALHVDYWDYIGWKDAFAQPKFTTRQRGYARAAGHRTIYTPQMIVQGSDHVVGYKPMELAEYIAAQRAKANQIPITLDAGRSGDRLTISLSATGTLPNGLKVQFVQFNPLERVQIKRGENAGKTVDYANIVTRWETVGTWNGQGTKKITLTTKSDDPVAILVQGEKGGGPGPILAAVRLD